LELQKIASEKKKLEEDSERLLLLRAQKRKANWAKVQSKWKGDDDKEGEEGEEGEEGGEEKAKKAEKVKEGQEEGEKEKLTEEEINERS